MITTALPYAFDADTTASLLVFNLLPESGILADPKEPALFLPVDAAKPVLDDEEDEDEDDDDDDDDLDEDDDLEDDEDEIDEDDDDEELEDDEDDEDEDEDDEELEDDDDPKPLKVKSRG